MVSQARLRLWSAVHRWTSLIATALLLLTCVTGLPLIFHDEIEDWLDPPPARQQPAANAVAPMLDALVARALADHPGSVAVSLGFSRPAPGSTEPPTVVVATGPDPQAPFAQLRRHTFDLRDGTLLQLPPPRTGGFMDTVLELHKNLLAGLPGALLLGAMGLLLVASVVSGVVVYGPFMRKLRFGTVRAGRRARWLDLHNLVGIGIAAWLLVVGTTGAINTLHDPIAAHWRAEVLPQMTGPYRGLPPPGRIGSIDAAIATARAAAPGMEVQSVFLPGTNFATPHHFGVYLRGATPLSMRILKPALVDATTGALSDIREMPWYVKALFVSQPLHFGDYGGLPMKWMWLVLDLLAIAVLVSGLYLWVVRRRRATEVPQPRPRGEPEAATEHSPSTWRMPKLLALCICAGLGVACVTTDAALKGAADFALAIPLAVVFWFVLRGLRR